MHRPGRLDDSLRCHSRIPLPCCFLRQDASLAWSSWGRQRWLPRKPQGSSGTTTIIPLWPTVYYTGSGLNPGPHASTVSSLRLSHLPSGLPWLKVFASTNFPPVSVPERLFSSAHVLWLVKHITVLTGTGGLNHYCIAKRFQPQPPVPPET